MAPMLLCGVALAGANRGRDSLGRWKGILTAEELCSLTLSARDLAALPACEPLRNSADVLSCAPLGRPIGRLPTLTR